MDPTNSYKSYRPLSVVTTSDYSELTSCQFIKFNQFNLLQLRPPNLSYNIPLSFREALQTGALEVLLGGVMHQRNYVDLLVSCG